MATWPATLPAPLAAGYGVQPADPVARTDMEAGPPRMRRRTAVRNDRVPVAFVLDAAQMAAFRAWFDDAATGIAGGSAWFDVSLDVGEGAAAVEARFLAVWQAEQLAPGLWRVSANWELR